MNEIYCDGCKESHKTNEVEFLNIEEDMHGGDVMTFFCVKSQYEGKSSVRKRY